MAASRVAGTPTTYTIYADASDGYINATAGNADGNGDNAFAAGAQLQVGQNVGLGYQAFLGFDTSTVVGTVTSVTLSLYGGTDASTTFDFVMEVRAHDWGTTVTTADWLSRATMATKTLVATLSTAGYSTSGYNTLTSEAAFLAAINTSGFTRLVLSSDRWRQNLSDGGGAAYVGFLSANTSGTTQDPKLVIEALV